MTVGGVNEGYNFTYTYNLAGSVTSEVYPSGRKVSIAHDLANRESSITGQLGSQTPQTNYASNVGYAPHGAPNSYVYPSGLNVQYGFNSRLQTCQIEHFLPPGDQPQTPLEEDVYWSASEPHCGVSSDNNGTVRMIENWNGATSAHPTFVTFLQNFTYDNANRLSTAQESNVTINQPPPYPVDWSRNLNYDLYGNMWLTNPTGITPPGNTPSAQSNFNASNNQLAASNYDAAGNQLMADGYQITYDAENRQTSASSGSTVVGTYSYDAEGNRVLRTTAAGTTVYVYDAFNQLAAEYSTSSVASSPCQTCYLHRDHLGTVRLVTDSSGNVVARHDYLPFGEEIPSGVPAGATGRGDTTWDASDNVNQKFTGQERDPESGLDYFGARYYGSALGRFTSPDPGNAGADLMDPQSWNGYSYVANNPLNSVDPSGACDVVIGGITQTPNTPETAQQQAFAQSVGAISVFPYANGGVGQGIAAIAEQSTNTVTAETQAVMNALSAAAADGEPVDVFAFSGGAQALTTAINNLPSSIVSQINNISYVSPGALQDLALSPTGGDTALVRSTGLLNLGIIGSVSPLTNPSNILTVGCGFFGHDANCEFEAAASFLRRFSGTPCSSTTGIFANYQSHSPTSGTATSTITYGPGGGSSGFSGGWVFEPMFGEEGNVIGGGWVLYPSPNRQELLPK